MGKGLGVIGGFRGRRRGGGVVGGGGGAVHAPLPLVEGHHQGEAGRHRQPPLHHLGPGDDLSGLLLRLRLPVQEGETALIHPAEKSLRRQAGREGRLPQQRQFLL